uniref:Uncharacterized protein n=1 Tax=Setaria italica TaxID=4555 RepID=K4A3Z9_SETIT
MTLFVAIGRQRCFSTSSPPPNTHMLPGIANRCAPVASCSPALLC